jgi:putative transport protein
MTYPACFGFPVKSIRQNFLKFCFLHLMLMGLVIGGVSHLSAEPIISGNSGLGAADNLISLATKPKIAVVYPHSGPYAKFGNLQMEGYKLAEVDIARNGSSAEIRYFDIGTDHPNLVEYMKNEVLSWGPDIIVGPYSSDGAISLASILESTNIPLLIPTATFDRLTNNPKSKVYRLASTAGFMATTTKEYISKNYKTWESKKIVILAEKSAFSEGAIKAFLAAKGEVDLPEMEVVEYQQGQLDDVLNKFEWDHSVVVSITRSELDCQKIVDGAQGKSILIGFSSGYLTPSFKKYIEKTKPELYIITPWQDDAENPAIKRFKEDFKRKYYNAFSAAEPQYHSVQAYSALVVANEALVTSRKTQADVFSVLNAMHVNTPMGEIRFVDFGGYYHQAPTTVVLQRVKEGKVTTEYPYEKSAQKKSLAVDLKAKKPSALDMLLGNQIIALFVIIALGLIFGEISLFNVSFGSSGVIFVALVFGHFQYTIPSGIGTLGLVLFIYCVGVSAGSAFFRAFVSKGADLAKLSVVVVSSAALTIFFSAKFFEVPISLASGIFAGALTSTPALAAAMDNLKESGSLVSVGYGIAYPFGVIGVVLFVQLIPKLLKQDLDQLAKDIGESKKKKKIVREWVEITNEGIVGNLISQAKFLESFSCQISRTYEQDKVVPVTDETIFRMGQVVLIVGEESDLLKVISLMGKKYSKFIQHTLEQERREIIITSKGVVGKSISELNTLKNYGIMITRIERGSNEFVPSGSTVLEAVDKLTVVGAVDYVEKFMKFAGHRAKAVNETDILSLIVGILAGVLLGKLTFALPGNAGFSLGLSGGPLLVALLLGHFGRIGKMTGRYPVAALNILRDIGLVFFLAQAGVSAGGSFIATINQYGSVLFLVGAIVTTVPLVVGYYWATYVMKLNLLEALGGICGGMTSTPALGSITAKTDSGIPVVSYATAYPVALILMIVLVSLIIELSAVFF